VRCGCFYFIGALGKLLISFENMAKLKYLAMKKLRAE
jgi:hypothetical protein